VLRCKPFGLFVTCSERGHLLSIFFFIIILVRLVPWVGFLYQVVQTIFFLHLLLLRIFKGRYFKLFINRKGNLIFMMLMARKSFIFIELGLSLGTSIGWGHPWLTKTKKFYMFFTNSLLERFLLYINCPDEFLRRVHRIFRSNNLSLKMNIHPTRSSWIIKYNSLNIKHNNKNLVWKYL